MSILHTIINLLTKLATIVRKQVVKSLNDMLCVSCIFSKDNCFPDSVTTSNLYSLFHQVLEYLINCIVIKQPFIQSRSANVVREGFLLIECCLKLFLFCFRQVVVKNAFFHKFR